MRHRTVTVERFDVALNTPAGRLTTAIDVPTGLIPITAIVPLTRRLGDEAAELEIQQAAETGHSISCRKGCAACCRMLVPLSAPEAFALREHVRPLPHRSSYPTDLLLSGDLSCRGGGLTDSFVDLSAGAPHALAMRTLLVQKAEPACGNKRHSPFGRR